MIQKITQNNGNFWTVNLIMRDKIVNQSSDFPVRRTGSYRHKKALILAPPFPLFLFYKIAIVAQVFYCITSAYCMGPWL